MVIRLSTYQESSHIPEWLQPSPSSSGPPQSYQLIDWKLSCHDVTVTPCLYRVLVPEYQKRLQAPGFPSTPEGSKASNSPASDVAAEDKENKRLSQGDTGGSKPLPRYQMPRQKQRSRISIRKIRTTQKFWSCIKHQIPQAKGYRQAVNLGGNLCYSESKGLRPIIYKGLFQIGKKRTNAQ